MAIRQGDEVNVAADGVVDEAAAVGGLLEPSGCILTASNSWMEGWTNSLTLFFLGALLSSKSRKLSRLILRRTGWEGVDEAGDGAGEDAMEVVGRVARSCMNFIRCRTVVGAAAALVARDVSQRGRTRLPSS